MDSGNSSNDNLVILPPANRILFGVFLSEDGSEMIAFFGKHCPPQVKIMMKAQFGSDLNVVEL